MRNRSEHVRKCRQLGVFLLYAVGLVMLLVGVLGFVIDCQPRSPVNRHQFEQLALGMGRPTVLNILGPPGNYLTEPPGYYHAPGYGWGGPKIRWGDPQRASHEERWDTDKGGVIVHYDEQGRVTFLMFAFTTKKLWWWGIKLHEFDQPDPGY